MGRKEPRKETKRASKAKASHAEGDDDFDVRSTTSHETNESSFSQHSAAAGKFVAADDLFEEEGERDELTAALDKLSEKRGTTRVEGLEQLLEVLQNASDLQVIYSRRAALQESLLGCLRRPSSESEAELAARALAALCVCLGPDEDAWYRQLSRLLEAAVTRGRKVGPRVEACRALAVACLICSSEADVQDSAMALLAAVFSRTSEGEAVPDELVAAALQGWGLLSTATAPQWLSSVAVGAYLPTLRDLLESSNADVRAAAGEAAALLREAVDEVQRSEAEEAEANGDVPPAASEEYGEMDDVWEDIANKMLAHSTETSKKLSKDAKKSQRKVFRELHAAITEGAPPSQELALQNGCLAATTWAEVKRLDSMRMCLQSGLQSQLQSNEHLRAMLNVEEGEAGAGGRGGGGGVGGGAILSKSSGLRKWRSEARSRQRASRQTAKDGFLHGEDVGGDE